jgi:folate-dependent phosphoribosylglycinamide formyltransferase PurN
MNQKLIIITNGNYFAQLILRRTFLFFRDSISGILIITGDYKGRKGLTSLFELSKNTALPYIIYKMVSILAFKFAQGLFPKACFLVEKLAEDCGTPIYRVDKVNSKEAISWVSSIDPDLIISVSCPQKISNKMLVTSKLGGINIHSSLLPSYAGLAPYHWVLSAGETQTGTTVHYMTQKFDEGNILVQRSISIEPQESAFHLFERLSVVGSEALEEAIQLAVSGYNGRKQNLEKYSYYSNPTFQSYINLKRNKHSLLRIKELISCIRSEIHKSQSPSMTRSA